MFRSIPGFYPLNVSSTFPVVRVENVSRYCSVVPGSKITLDWEGLLQTPEYAFFNLGVKNKAVKESKEQCDVFWFLFDKDHFDNEVGEAVHRNLGPLPARLVIKFYDLLWNMYHILN